MVNINIKLSNKTFYLLVAIIAILAVAGVAIALNSGDYLVHGHDSGEIQGGGGGITQSVQAVGTTDISYDSNIQNGDVPAYYVDMADMSTTITTTGGDVLVIFSAMVRTAEAYGGYARLLIDGTEKHRIGWEMGSNAGFQTISLQWLEKNLPAGSHTIKIQWKEQAAMIYQDGSTYPRVLTIFEL